MGGGASSVQGVENLLATTMMIGRAIAAITFPGMFRIYDFHSKKAPKIKNNNKSFVMFGYVSDDEDEAIDPTQYAHLFHVQVGDDVIYLDDPLAANDAGWTPLHTCCMSPTTIPAGMKLIEEVLYRGGSLDSKTIAGPGTFNRGWTPLHMACAYGVELMAEKLILEGADVNTTNCFGFSPLFEACHRGYIGIVTCLMKSRHIDLSYIPSNELAQESPFVSNPPQSALGEASRAGFHKIVQILIDAGAEKDQRNSLGWTPLHEACFYNRIECVKVLLLSGANPCLRTSIGALPYHLAGFQVLKSMIVDMGGPDAAPEEGDIVDMMTILKEMAMIDDTPVYSPVALKTLSISNHQEPQDDDTQSPSMKTKNRNQDSQQSAKQTDRSVQDSSRIGYLHTGPVLGNLPSLLNITSPTSNSSSPSHRPGQEFDSLLSNGRQGQLFSNDGSGKARMHPSKRADEKKPKKKNQDSQHVDSIPADTPPAYICQLTQRLMTEPVKSTYGHVYDKAAITQWLNQQGRICPLTGAPLSENNLSPMAELSDEIKVWIVRRSMGNDSSSPQPLSQDRADISESNPKTIITSNKGPSQVNEDLYDF